jgi:serine/threonine-protein phosphatase 2B catalytic subunit
MGEFKRQFFDTREIFRLGGNPANTKYLFLGDYVDRGVYGVEVLLVLFALKIDFPNQIFLLRGNHECRQLTAYHFFRDECIQKYDQEIYDLFIEAFERMPLACVINGHFLALHGGISPEIQNCLQINQIN